MSAEHQEERIKCEICSKTFKSITNSHLRDKHNLTTIEYKNLFPGSKMISDLHNSKLDVWRKSDDNKKHFIKIGEIARHSEIRKQNVRIAVRKQDYRDKMSLIMKDVVKTLPNSVMFDRKSGIGHHHYKKSNYQRWVEKHGEEIANEKMQDWMSKNIIPTKSKYTSGEMYLIEILDRHNIKYETQYVILNYYVDFFLPDKNLVIEIQGDYWHCSPRRYKEDDYVKFPGRGLVKVSDIWQRDGMRFEKIKSLGYNIIGLFSHDLNEEYILKQLDEDIVRT